MIEIRITDQLLHHRRRTGVWHSYPISSAARGTGNRKDSLQTPLGRHRIEARIGRDMPIFTAFRGRQPFCIYSRSNKCLPTLPWMAGKRAGVCEAYETRTFRMAYKQKSLKTFANQQSDWILSRILWLSGCATGANRRGAVDTLARYIYIHGTHAEALIGQPVSHGCIRMCNTDIIELFEHTHLHETVLIRP